MNGQFHLIGFVALSFFGVLAAQVVTGWMPSTELQYVGCIAVEITVIAFLFWLLFWPLIEKAI